MENMTPNHNIFWWCCFLILSATDAKRYDLIAELLERRQQQDMLELNAALNEFRLLHQQPSGRREWDLYDPDRLKKDKPARVSDDDPRCGISSMQKFEGEDLSNKVVYFSQLYISIGSVVVDHNFLGSKDLIVSRG